MYYGYAGARHCRSAATLRSVAVEASEPTEAQSGSYLSSDLNILEMHFFFCSILGWTYRLSVVVMLA